MCIKLPRNCTIDGTKKKLVTICYTKKKKKKEIARNAVIESSTYLSTVPTRINDVLKILKIIILLNRR